MSAEQSYISDELIHFVGGALRSDEDRFHLLLQILSTGWLRASHREELGAGFVLRSDPRRPLSSNEAVISPALCFCDIPSEALGRHMANYGPFGIAFLKKKLVRNGASPVFYVARDAAFQAPGIGPRTLKEKFDEVFAEFGAYLTELDSYVRRQDGPRAQEGALSFTLKHSPPGTPAGLRILGKLYALRSDLGSLVFSRLKFFDAHLAQEHRDNFYMEREWRIPGGLAFTFDDLEGIYIPRAFWDRLLARFPSYQRKLRPSDPQSAHLR